MPDQPDDTSPIWEFTTVNVTPTPEVSEVLSKIPGLSRFAQLPDDGESPR